MREIRQKNTNNEIKKNTESFPDKLLSASRYKKKKNVNNKITKKIKK